MSTRIQWYSIAILCGFQGGSKGFQMDAIGCLSGFSKDSLGDSKRNSIRILKGFKRIMKDFYKDSKRASNRIL